jgi:hypothetical protein
LRKGGHPNDLTAILDVTKQGSDRPLPTHGDCCPTESWYGEPDSLRANRTQEPLINDVLHCESHIPWLPDVMEAANQSGAVHDVRFAAIVAFSSPLAGRVVTPRLLGDGVEAVVEVDEGDEAHQGTELVLVIMLCCVGPGLVVDTATVGDSGSLLG